MSCRMVRMGLFVLALSLFVASVRAVAGEPPKKPLADKPAASAKAKPKSESAAMLHGGEKAILKALKRKVSLEFVKTPLKDVVDHLSNEYRIPIVLDARALKEAGIEESAPITIKVSGISLQSALETFLDDLKLKWAIHHEALMITSPERAESDELMCTKVYDVTDIILPIPDTSIQYNPLTEASGVVSDPTTVAAEQPPVFNSGRGPWPTTYMQRQSIGRVYPAYRSDRLDFQQLTDLMAKTVSTKSWLENGGQGTIIDNPSGFLVVSQTQEVHWQIEKLLADVRAHLRAVPGFRIELYWLWLDAAQRDTLFARDGKETKNRGSRAIVPQRLSQVVRDVPCFRAQANCLNGQNAVLVAGDRRALIVNAIPAEAGGGYQPVVSMPNVGVSAAVQPILQPGTNRVILTVRSTITRWTPTRGPALVGAAWPLGKHFDVSATQPEVSVPIPAAANSTPPASGGRQGVANDPVKVSSAGSHSSMSSHGGGSSSCPIDLPVMPTQEFGTTLRVPLGKPVIVGSVTFAPEGDAGLGAAKQDAVEVYLIATTSLVEKGKASSKNGNPKSEARNPKQIGNQKSE